ncbi:MAG: aspartate aminotransferase family protein [Oligoflexales bacterium]|nr:aspartate aminotransferase family protein [Oligoflexales bacterium]
MIHVNHVSQELQRRLVEVECKDSTFSYAPLVLHKAQGSKIWDVDGNEFIDLCAGFGVMAMGHSNAAVDATLRHFLSSDGEKKPILHGMGDVYPSVYKIELLEKIKSLLPLHFNKGGLALSGAQAVEYALKTAIITSKKSGFISFQGSYHGVDIGVLPITSRRDFRNPFERWFYGSCRCGQKASILSNYIELPFGCEKSALESAIDRLDAQGSGCAAVIIEPIQGRAGIRIPAEGWLQMLREVTSSREVFLIFDEVFVGFGRAGKLTFTQDVKSDLVCLGKSLGGGFPISAVFGTEKAMEGWPENKGEAIHTGTFFGHPFSCYMALKNIEAIEKDKLINRSCEFGKRAISYLNDKIGFHPAVKAIRGLGLMIGIEFHRDGRGALLAEKLRTKGVIVLPSGERGECLSITPALTIEEMLLFQSFDIIADSVDEIFSD